MFALKRRKPVLTGKIVLVTGSSRGIGASIARLAKSCGAKVIVHGRTETRELKRLGKDLNAPCVAFDVSDKASVEREVGKLAKADFPIDILINNAGVNPSKTFQNLSNADWKDIFNANFFGVVNVSRIVINQMMARKSGGSIVNITSIKGFTHVAGKPGYASSKAALIQLTARMAEEFAPYNIRINAVAPGFVGTEMTAATLEQEEKLGKTKLRDQIAKIPMRRMAEAEEISEAVCFLASDKAGYITGQCLAVDGGLSIV